MFSLAASEALLGLSSPGRAKICQRLKEIAQVAELFASPGADGVQTTLRFAAAGLKAASQVVSYVVSDKQRTLTVTSIVSAEPG